MKFLESQPGHVVAVSHPFVIRAAMLYVLQFPVSMFYRIDVEPLSAIELRFKGRGPWKKGLPMLLQTLEALGRAQSVGGEGHAAWRG